MGLTLIDAGVLVGFLDSNDAHHYAAGRELQRAQRRGDKLAIPASAFAEAMVSPSLTGQSAIDTVLEFVDRLPLTVVAFETTIALIAARLRARHGQKLKLPDALVVATAIRSEAEILVTTDRGWPSKTHLGFKGQLIRL